MHKLFAFLLCIFLIFTPFTRLLGEQSEPFKIGGIAALTGPASNWGSNAVRGWQFAVDEINKHGGANGRQIKLIIEDSKTSGSGAVASFHKLKNIDKVDAMVGDVWDFITTPLIPLADSAKTLLVSTIIDESTHLQSQYFYTVGPKIKTTANALNTFFKLNQTIKRYAILGWENDWGYAYEKVWNSAATHFDAKNISTQRLIDINADWRAEMLKLATLKPDAVFFGYQADRIIKRANELKLKPIYLTTSNIVEELMNKTLPNELSEGIYFTDWLPNSEFIQAYTTKYGSSPILNASEAYEAIRSIVNAYQHNSHDLAAGMKSVNYKGISGNIDFRNSNAGNFSEAKLFKVSNGTWNMIE